VLFLKFEVLNEIQNKNANTYLSFKDVLSRKICGAVWEKNLILEQLAKELQNIRHYARA
jgi:hypothetical protein